MGKGGRPRPSNIKGNYRPSGGGKGKPDSSRGRPTHRRKIPVTIHRDRKK